MDVGTQLVATPEPATAIGDGDRVACPAVSNTVANVVTVGRSALRLNEGIVSGPPTERGRVTICGAMLELALATIGEVAPSTKYAKVCNVIGKSLHGQLHLVGKQSTPRSLVWHTVFFEYRGSHHGGRKGRPW